MIAEIVALILFSGVVLYACFGGADFGVGAWDLTAGGDKRGAPIRGLIDRSIGPVWEANHVWLVFVLVYIWTGFPDAFAAIAETLWIPLSLAGLGIVLRGAAFAFRKFSPTVAYARFYGVLFAVSSVVTPFFFGTVAGAVASGTVPLDGQGDPIASWTGTTSIVGGVLAVLTCAFLAAVLLTYEAGRTGDQKLISACRARAIGIAVAAGALVLVALLPVRSDAPVLYEGLTTTALPLVIASIVAGFATILFLWKQRVALARITALLAVAAVVFGWGVAQYPFLIVDVVTIDQAAGATATLWGLLIVFGITAITVVPSLVYLYWVTQRSTWLSGVAADVDATAKSSS
jgi:cytochrome bd ubiquinol oxidase subunit II